MRLLGNIIWIIFSGLELAVANLVLGCIFCITIIGIPFGMQYASMTDAGLKILERTNLGSPEGKEKDFKRQVGDEKIALVTYMAEK